MEWEVFHHRARPARAERDEQTPGGVFHFPAFPAEPARDVHLGRIASRNWTSIEQQMVQYWVKLCDLVERHRGKRSVLPWNRIVFSVDVVNCGKLMSHLRQGNTMPPHEGPFTVVTSIPFFVEYGREASKRHCGIWEALEQWLLNALRLAARREPARSALRGLRRRNFFRLFYYDEDSVMHPLRSAKKIALPQLHDEQPVHRCRTKKKVVQK